MIPHTGVLLFRPSSCRLFRHTSSFPKWEHAQVTNHVIQGPWEHGAGPCHQPLCTSVSPTVDSEASDG
jgi:hypothetical protein